MLDLVAAAMVGSVIGALIVLAVTATWGQPDQPESPDEWTYDGTQAPTYWPRIERWTNRTVADQTVADHPGQLPGNDDSEFPWPPEIGRGWYA